MALMVKSRLAASSCQSSVQATRAWRPSVSSSRRSVVISMFSPALSAVTVPWAMPVAMVRMPAWCSARCTASGGSGVAMSMSVIATPAIVSRTQPPTSLACFSASRIAPPRDDAGWCSFLAAPGNHLAAAELGRHIGASDAAALAQPEQQQAHGEQAAATAITPVRLRPRTPDHQAMAMATGTRRRAISGVAHGRWVVEGRAGCNAGLAACRAGRHVEPMLSGELLPGSPTARFRCSVCSLRWVAQSRRDRSHHVPDPLPARPGRLRPATPAGQAGDTCAARGLRLSAGGRPADRDTRNRDRHRGGRARPGAAWRDRLRQDLHHGEGDRGGAAAGAGAGAEQDAGGAALRGDEILLP